MDWPGHKRQRSTLRLYRNNRNGTFTDVTRAAGLDVELYGMGVAVGDYDNDGFPDILVTCVGQNRLFHNTGRGTFVDVTRASGLDGRAGVQHVGDVGGHRPRRPPGSLRLQLREVVARERRVLQRRRQAQVLLHARGVSRRHVLALPQPRQRHVRGRHRDLRHLRLQLEGARRGAHRSRSGRLARHLRGQRHAAQQAVSQPAQRPVPGRGAGSRRRAQRGRQGAGRHGRGRRVSRRHRPPVGGRDQLRGRDGGAVQRHATGRHLPRYARSRPAWAPPRATASGSAARSRTSTSTARVDLVVANGHIDATVRNIRSGVGHAQAPHLFLNQGRGRFQDVAPALGGAFASPRVGRGLAYGDFDRDGDVDLLLTTNNGPARAAAQRPAGGQQERAAAADRHDVEPRCDRRAGSRVPRRRRRRRGWSRAAPATCRSPSCRSPSASAGGTGSIAWWSPWPSGRTEEFTNVAAGRAYECVEGKGLSPAT